MVIHNGLSFHQAMQIGLPVIAVNSGGPTETIVHQKTGFLCNQVSCFKINSKI
jgi:glycosyltransferase involved in cell wall biosynthesis